MRVLSVLREQFLIESLFANIDTLKSQLNETAIAMMNDFAGGDDWSKCQDSQWSKTINYLSKVEELNAFIELFIEYNYRKWGCTLDQLEDGKEVLIKLIDEMGFEESENPYISFMKTFFNKQGRGVVLSREDWITLNDALARGVSTESDLRGTGPDRSNYILFNPNFYTINDVQDQVGTLKAYEDLSEERNIKQLNLYAISNYSGSPYSTLKQYTSGGTQGSGQLTDKSVSPKTIRNIIMFENPDNPLGKIRPYSTIKKALQVGTQNIYSNTKDAGDNKSKQKNLDNIYNALKQLSQEDRNNIIAQLLQSGLVSST